MAQATKITVEATANAPVAKVWKAWNTPGDIMQWNAADPSWHSPSSENDLRVGGKFKHRMEAKDASFGFDFGGTFNDVQEHRKIVYTIGDGRKVELDFSSEGEATNIVEKFEAESTHSLEMQKAGWQAILDNFKKYTETN